MSSEIKESSSSPSWSHRQKQIEQLLIPYYHLFIPKAHSILAQEPHIVRLKLENDLLVEQGISRGLLKKDLKEYIFTPYMDDLTVCSFCRNFSYETIQHMNAFCQSIASKPEIREYNQKMTELINTLVDTYLGKKVPQIVDRSILRIVLDTSRLTQMYSENLTRGHWISYNRQVLKDFLHQYNHPREMEKILFDCRFIERYEYSRYWSVVRRLDTLRDLIDGLAISSTLPNWTANNPPQRMSLYSKTLIGLKERFMEYKGVDGQFTGEGETNDMISVRKRRTFYEMERFIAANKDLYLTTPLITRRLNRRLISKIQYIDIKWKNGSPSKDLQSLITKYEDDAAIVAQYPEEFDDSMFMESELVQVNIKEMAYLVSLFHDDVPSSQLIFSYQLNQLLRMIQLAQLLQSTNDVRSRMAWNALKEILPEKEKTEFVEKLFKPRNIQISDIEDTLESIQIIDIYTLITILNRLTSKALDWHGYFGTKVQQDTIAFDRFGNETSRQQVYANTIRFNAETMISAASLQSRLTPNLISRIELISRSKNNAYDGTGTISYEEMTYLSSLVTGEIAGWSWITHWLAHNDREGLMNRLQTGTSLPYRIELEKYRSPIGVTTDAEEGTVTGYRGIRVPLSSFINLLRKNPKLGQFASIHLRSVYSLDFLTSWSSTHRFYQADQEQNRHQSNQFSMLSWASIYPGNQLVDINQFYEQVGPKIGMPIPSRTVDSFLVYPQNDIPLQIFTTSFPSVTEDNHPMWLYFCRALYLFDMQFYSYWDTINWYVKVIPTQTSVSETSDTYTRPRLFDGMKIYPKELTDWTDDVNVWTDCMVEVVRYYTPEEMTTRRKATQSNLLKKVKKTRQETEKQQQQQEEEKMDTTGTKEGRKKQNANDDLFWDGDGDDKFDIYTEEDINHMI